MNICSAWGFVLTVWSLNMWRKGVVAENRAGTLVRMAEGQAVTYKLTKRLAEMVDTGELPERVRQALAAGEDM